MLTLFWLNEYLTCYHITASTNTGTTKTKIRIETNTELRKCCQHCNEFYPSFCNNRCYWLSPFNWSIRGYLILFYFIFIIKHIIVQFFIFYLYLFSRTMFSNRFFLRLWHHSWSAHSFLNQNCIILLNLVFLFQLFQFGCSLYPFDFIFDAILTTSFFSYNPANDEPRQTDLLEKID